MSFFSCFFVNEVQKCRVLVLSFSFLIYLSVLMGQVDFMMGGLLHIRGYLRFSVSSSTYLWVASLSVSYLLA